MKVCVFCEIRGLKRGLQDEGSCPGFQKKRARTDFRSAPEIAHFPPKIPAWLLLASDRLPPGDRSGRLRKWRGIKNMSERFSVCRSRLSSFVGDKLPLIFGFWKAIEVPFPAKWVQNRTWRSSMRGKCGRRGRKLWAFQSGFRGCRGVGCGLTTDYADYTDEKLDEMGCRIDFPSY